MIQLYKHLYVPHCVDIAAMDVVRLPYGADKVDDKCIVVCLNDESKIFTMLQAAAEVRVAVLDYYRHSGSYLWHPEPGDEVYRVVTPDQSAIRQIHVFHDSKAIDQYNYTGNCYRTEEEAQGLLEKIKSIFNKFGIII